MLEYLNSLSLTIFGFPFLGQLPLILGALGESRVCQHILLLGTAYLANPENGDAFKMNITGLQSETRQKELREVMSA